MSKVRAPGLKLVPFRVRGQGGTSLMRSAKLRAINLITPDGEIHATLPSLTQVMLGLSGTAVAGGITQTLPSLTQTMTAVEEMAGPVTQTLPSLTQTMAASVIANALIAQTLPSLTQVSVGTTGTEVSGGITQTLPNLTQVLTGVGDMGAEIAQVLPSLTQTASAFRSDHAAIAQTLPPLTQTMTAILSNGGFVVSLLPQLTQLMEGGPVGEQFAVIDQTLPQLTQLMVSGIPGQFAVITQTLPSLTQTATGTKFILDELYDSYPIVGGIGLELPRLASPQGIAAFLGRSIDDGDFLANLMCSMASQVVRSYLGQLVHFVDNDEVTLDGTGTGALLLPELPVVRVNSVTTHDSDGENPVVLEVTDYVLGSGGILYRTTVYDYWTLGRQNVTVNYDHGWDVGIATGSLDPTDNALMHVPADILLVALRVASRGFMAGSTLEGGGSSLKASETIGVDTYSYTNVASDAAITAATQSAQQLASDERDILDRYAMRRVA